MTTQTLTLTDFLLARIAEDEAEIGSFGEPAPMEEGPIPYSRLLAECEAKRRIVDEHGIAADLHEQDYCQTCGLPDGFEWGGVPYPCPTLRFLALPYADHDNYQEEWRP